MSDTALVCTSLPVKSLLIRGDNVWSFCERVTKTSAPVVTDATSHQDQHFKLNQTLIDIGIGLVVKNFSSGKVSLARIAVLMEISNLSRWKVLTLFLILKEILCFWSCVSVLLGCSVLPGGEWNRNLFNSATEEVLCCYTLPWQFFKCVLCAYVYFNFSLGYTHTIWQTSSCFGNFNFQFSYLLLKPKCFVHACVFDKLSKECISFSAHSEDWLKQFSQQL